MLWARLLAYVSGTVNQELLLRNEYLAAENRILRGQIKGRLPLSEGEKATLAEIAYRLVKNLKRIEKARFPFSFLAQLLSETLRAGTIRVRHSSLGRLWNDLGSHACLDHRNRRPGTFTEDQPSHTVLGAPQEFRWFG
jgi:hypothetical protein